MIGDGEVIERAYKNAGKSTPQLFKVVGHGNSKGIEFRGRVVNAEEPNFDSNISGVVVKLYSKNRY